MSNVALALVFAAFIVLAAGVTLTMVTFSSGLAAAVVHAERLSPNQADQISTHLRRRRPILSRTQRLDHHDAYVWPMASLWFVGLGVILAPAANSAVTELSWDAQKALGVCILVGSTVALVGAVLGTRLPGGRYIARSVADNMVSELIGDDVRIPYTFGWLGLMSVGVGLAGYGWTIYQYSTLVGTLGGALTFGLVGMCITLGFKFVAHIRRYVRRRNELLAEVATRMNEAQ